MVDLKVRMEFSWCSYCSQNFQLSTCLQLENYDVNVYVVGIVGEFGVGMGY